MKVISPIGEYPFQFRRLERREGGVALIGTIGGIESSLLFDREDLRSAARSFAVPLAALLLLAAWHRRRARPAPN